MLRRNDKNFSTSCFPLPAFQYTEGHFFSFVNLPIVVGLRLHLVHFLARDTQNLGQYICPWFWMSSFLDLWISFPAPQVSSLSLVCSQQELQSHIYFDKIKKKNDKRLNQELIKLWKQYAIILKSPAITLFLRLWKYLDSYNELKVFPLVNRYYHVSYSLSS